MRVKSHAEQWRSSTAKIIKKYINKRISLKHKDTEKLKVPVTPRCHAPSAMSKLVSGLKAPFSGVGVKKVEREPVSCHIWGDWSLRAGRIMGASVAKGMVSQPQLLLLRGLLWPEVPLNQETWFV